MAAAPLLRVRVLPPSQLPELVHELSDYAVELVVHFGHLLGLLYRTARFLLRCKLLPLGERWVGRRALKVVVDKLHGLVEEEQRRVLPIRRHHRQSGQSMVVRTWG